MSAEIGQDWFSLSMGSEPWRAEISRSGLGYSIRLIRGVMEYGYWSTWTAQGAIRKSRRLLEQKNGALPKRRWVVR